MLCLPGHGHLWSRPAGGLPTSTSTLGQPSSGTAPCVLLCPTVRPCPAVPGDKAPSLHNTFTLPGVPRKLLSEVVWPLVTASYSEQKILMCDGHDVDGAIFCTITPVYSV